MEHKDRCVPNAHLLDAFIGLTVLFFQTVKPQYMFQYFLKVVSTQFQTIDGQIVRVPFFVYCVQHQIHDDHLGQISSVQRYAL